MKNIIIIMMMLSTILFSDLFDTNTDVKSKYEFDITLTKENERLFASLQRFQNNEVSEEEIATFLSKRAQSKKLPFESDVYLDKEFVFDVEHNQTQESFWYSFSLPSWLGGDDANNTTQGDAQ